MPTGGPKIVYEREMHNGIYFDIQLPTSNEVLSLRFDFDGNLIVAEI